VLDADAAAKGCRIVFDEATEGAYAPRCEAEANRHGLDGTSCEKGSDCAPGYDCIEGEKGAVCRHYCCAGGSTCSEFSSQNGGPTFCDIQKLVDGNEHKAPVCMPLKKCKLLTPSECSDSTLLKETCAVVTEKGDTGCVIVGKAQAGDSCDEEHCGVGLTCLGNWGDRRCYKLCRTERSDCGPTQTCTTGAVFQDTTFGVCKQTSPSP
jgi:hypothetical protein